MNSINSSSDHFSIEEVEISIVIPAYNEEGNLRKLHSQLMNVLPQINESWEIIFSDDGSEDSTWDVIRSLCEENKNTKGIRLSRNFGHQYALLAGLSNSRGRAVITMDSDFQHPPELIELVAEWQKGNKIVHTVRIDTENISFFKKITSKLFYRIWSFLSGIEIESGMADFRLLDRKVVDSILEFREEGIFLRGIVQWVGYPCSKVSFHCQERFRGTSKYTLGKMIKFAIAGITSFSVVPLRVGIFIGAVTGMISFVEIIYALYAKFILKTAVPGWTSAVSIISFLFGILFILLGIIGLYIGNVLVEVKRRPRFLISEFLDG